MALATVTGTLSDVGGGHLAGLHPELVFTLNQPGLSSGTLYATQPEPVAPASNGAWSVDLADTSKMSDDCYYTLAIRWQDPDGKRTRVDFPDWKIRVPTGGGNIADLRGPGSNQSMVYVSTTPPDNPTPFMLWLEQDPDNPDPSNPANTGTLHRWENI